MCNMCFEESTANSMVIEVSYVSGVVDGGHAVCTSSHRMTQLVEAFLSRVGVLRTGHFCTESQLLTTCMNPLELIDSSASLWNQQRVLRRSATRRSRQNPQPRTSGPRMALLFVWSAAQRLLD